MKTILYLIISIFFWKITDYQKWIWVKDCVNIKTNYPLKFDIYIKEINTIIECDGIQHNKKDSYFNNLVIKSGYTPTYITDEIKENYCKEHNMKLIRIPYTKCVDMKYVESFLCA